MSVALHQWWKGGKTTCFKLQGEGWREWLRCLWDTVDLSSCQANHYFKYKQKNKLKLRYPAKFMETKRQLVSWNCYWLESCSMSTDKIKCCSMSLHLDLLDRVKIGQIENWQKFKPSICSLSTLSSNSCSIVKYIVGCERFGFPGKSRGVGMRWWSRAVELS